MADEALRSAARSWRTSGDPSDLARLVHVGARAGTLPEGAADLAERVAAGAVSFDDLELAALLGDPLARAIAGEALAERCAYLGRDRAFDVGAAQGPIGWELLDDWLQVAAAMGRRALALVLVGSLEALRDIVRARQPAIDEGDGYAEFFVEMHTRDQGFAIADLDLFEAAIEGWLAGGSRADAAAQILAGRDRFRTTAFLYDFSDVLCEAAELALNEGLDLPTQLRRWAANAARVVPPDRLVAAARARVAPRLLGVSSPTG